MSFVGNAGDAFLGDDFGKQGFGNDRADTNHKGKANRYVFHVQFIFPGYDTFREAHNKSLKDYNAIS